MAPADVGLLTAIQGVGNGRAILRDELAAIDLALPSQQQPGIAVIAENRSQMLIYLFGNDRRRRKRPVRLQRHVGKRVDRSVRGQVVLRPKGLTRRF